MSIQYETIWECPLLIVVFHAPFIVILNAAAPALLLISTCKGVIAHIASREFVEVVDIGPVALRRASLSKVFS